MLGLNERVTSVDVPLGPDSDRSLLDTIADQQVRIPPSCCRTRTCARASRRGWRS